MRCLLDSNAVIHVWQGWTGFGRALEDALVDPSNTVYMSSVSAAELAIKISSGKLEPPPRPMPEVIELLNWVELPFTVKHAERMYQLPDVHKDPFDRMIIAQALTEGLPVVTTDRIFAAYGIQVIQGRADLQVASGR